MNALLALLLIGQTTIVVDPASKSTIEIKTQAQISVLPTGVKIVNGGVTIFLAKDSVVVPDVKPTPVVPVPGPVDEVLNDRAKDFLSTFIKSVPDAQKRIEAAKVAVPVIESIVGQAGGLGWTRAQVVENLAVNLNAAKFGEYAKGFKFGDWLSSQDTASVEDLVAVLKDVVSALKGPVK
jgi:hypothetical protein